MTARCSERHCRHLSAVGGSCLALVLVALACGQTESPRHTDPQVSVPSADKSGSVAAEYFRSASALQNRQLYDLAAVEWASFLERFPNDALAGQARHERGVCLFQLERFEEALGEFQHVVDRYPKLQPDVREEAQASLGLCQYNLGRLAEGPAAAERFAAAIEAFDKQLKRFPQGKYAPQARFHRAEAHYARGELAEAVAAYRSFVKLHPDHELQPQALYGLGVAEQESGDLEATSETFDQFLEKYPDHAMAADAHLRRGEVLMSLDRLEDAEKHFAAAAASEALADRDYALERQALCRYQLDDYAEAALLYVRLVKQFPHSPLAGDAAVAAGKCYYLAGNLSKAVEWLRRGEQAVSGKPEAVAEATHWLARALVRDGRASEAVDVVDKVLAADPPADLRARLEFDRADAIYELPDRRGEAVEAYATVAGTYPDDPLAAQAAYMAAYAALEVEDFQTALRHAESFDERFADHKLAPDVGHVAAEAQLQLGQAAEAADAFGRLLADFPQHDQRETWLVRRALCLSLAGEHQQIVDMLDSGWQDLATAEARAEAGLLLGKSLTATGKAERAVDVLTDVAALPSWQQADQVLLELARAQHAAGDTAKAIATVDRLIGQFPEFPQLDRAYYDRAEYHAALGNDRLAVADWQQVADRWPNSPMTPHALLAAAGQLRGAQHLASAQGCLTRLLSKFPDHELAPQAQLLRATIRHELHLYGDALKDIRAFLNGDPDRRQRSDALLLRGLCEAGRASPGNAIATFEKLLEEDPDYAAADRALYELAFALQNENQPARATETFIRLAETYPDSDLAAECWYRVGVSQFADKKYADAIASFQAADAKADDQLREKSAHKLAWAHFEQGEFAAAEAAFARQVEQCPTGPLAADGRIMLAESRFEQENYAGALEAFTTALEQRPSREELHTLAMLHAAQSAAQTNQWQQSVDLLDRCEREHPASAWTNEIRYERGWAFYHQQRLDEARQEFEAVLAADGGVLGARARFMIGEIQFAKQLYDDAVRTFFKVAYGYGGDEAPQEIHHWQAEAMFEAARCLERTERHESARKLYRELLERFPESAKAAHARNSLRNIKQR